MLIFLQNNTYKLGPGVA